jgi:hypothetical protein
MPGYFSSWMGQRLFALIIPISVIVWLVTPTVIAAASLFASLALLTAFAWTVGTTYTNAQPAASLAQALEGADRVSSPAHRRHPR